MKRRERRDTVLCCPGRWPWAGPESCRSSARQLLDARLVSGVSLCHGSREGAPPRIHRELRHLAFAEACASPSVRRIRTASAQVPLVVALVRCHRNVTALCHLPCGTSGFVYVVSLAVGRTYGRCQARPSVEQWLSPGAISAVTSSQTWRRVGSKQQGGDAPDT